jgi:hypothetical protein
MQLKLPKARKLNKLLRDIEKLSPTDFTSKNSPTKEEQKEPELAYKCYHENISEDLLPIGLFFNIILF